MELYVEDGATVEAGTKLCRIDLAEAPAQDRQATSTSREATPPSEPVSETPKAPPPPPPPPPAPTAAVDTPIPATMPPIPPLPSMHYVL